jgi:hypothetical protein
MKYMRITAGYTWTDCKTNIQIAKELKTTPILDKLLEYKRNWIQITQGNETLLSDWQKESWQTFEENSGHVKPERVDRWPNCMR